MIPEDISLTHREAWNKVAEQLGLGIRWQQDSGEPHVIDSLADLYISPEDARKYGVKEGVSLNSLPKLVRAIDRISAELEARRVRNVELSYSLRPIVETNPTMSALSEPEREVIRRLLPAIPILQELDIILKDGRGPDFLDYLRQGNHQASLLEFERNGFNACSAYLERRSDAEPEFCSPVDYFPNPLPTMGTYYPNSLVPRDLTEEGVAAMTSAYPNPVFNPFLSVMTVVKSDGDGGTDWSWKKVSQDSRVKPLIDQLVPVLENAAQTPGIDDGKKAQLLQAVASWLSPDPFSHYAEDATWAMENGGALEMIVGLSGGYTPMGKVSGAGLFLAVERKGEEAFFAQHLSPLLLELERRMAERSEGAYTARPLTTEGVLRVVDVIASTATDTAETLAFVGPDGGAATQWGLSKRVILANHHEVKAEMILLPIARVALAADQLAFVSKKQFAETSFAHEMMHPVGPRPTQLMADGKTSRDSVGAGVFDMIEESKANVGGLVAFALMGEKGVPGMDEVHLKTAYTTYVAGLIRQMRFGGKAHGGGAAAEMAFLFHKGAVSLGSKTLEHTGKGDPILRVNYDKMPEAVEALWLHIGRIQATGDRELGERLVNNLPQEAIPDEFDAILERINAANIPVDVDIRYPDLAAKLSPDQVSG